MKFGQLDQAEAQCTGGRLMTSASRKSPKKDPTLCQQQQIDVSNAESGYSALLFRFVH